MPYKSLSMQEKSEKSAPGPRSGVRKVQVDAEDAGQRVDNFLRKELPGVPKSRLYRLLRRGEVRINGGRVRADHRLEAGDEVRIPPARLREPGTHPSPAHAAAIAERVLFEDKRLLVMAEENAQGGSPWYHEGFDLTQETPYVFHSVEELDAPAACNRNRGSANSPLFLVNHWIERVNPSPGLAAKVNDFELLIRRARRCRDERELLPTILAVDFYDEGDLLEVVNVLNGLPRR